MKLVEVLTPSRTYWHVTPHTRLQKIMAMGIIPSRRRQWTNHMGARLGQTKMIYLFSNYNSAIRFAAKLEWGLKSEGRKSTQVDILEIISDVPVQADDNIEAQLDGGGWWRTPRPIPAAAIQQVIPLTRDMVKEFIARRNAPVQPAG